MQNRAKEYFLSYATLTLRAALELHEAFQDTGFAIVVNHGISKEISDRLREHSLKYFSLDIDTKSFLADGKSLSVSNNSWQVSYDCMKKEKYTTYKFGSHPYNSFYWWLF